MGETVLSDVPFRRLRKGPPALTPDAAGRTTAHTATRGKAHVHPSSYAQIHATHLHHQVPGRSYVNTQHLLTQDAQSTIAVQPRPPSSRTRGKPDQVYGGACHLAPAQDLGAGNTAHAKRQYGHAHTDTTSRVLVWASPADASDGPSGSTTVTYFSSRRQQPLACRPGTAPPCMVLVKTAARSAYERCSAGHADVIQYRHSGGICPAEYKMSGQRSAAPHLASPNKGDARTNFFDTRSSYDAIRMKSMWHTGTQGLLG